MDENGVDHAGSYHPRVRSPMGRGKSGGALAGTHPVDCWPSYLAELVRATTSIRATIDDVLVGCVSQVLEQAAPPAGWLLLAAGFPEHVPADRSSASADQVSRR